MNILTAGGVVMSELSQEKIEAYMGKLRFKHPPMFDHPELKPGEVVMIRGPISVVMGWVEMCHRKGMSSARASIESDANGEFALIVRQDEYCLLVARYLETKKDK